MNPQVKKELLRLQEEAQSSPFERGGWVATFADLSTLMLTFFVLLLSFANMDVVKFREMLGSIQDALGYQDVAFGNWNPKVLSTRRPHQDSEHRRSHEVGGDHRMLATKPSAEDVPSAPNPNLVAPDRPEGVLGENSLEDLAENARALINLNALSEAAEVKVTRRGVVVRIRDGILFAPGSADIRPEAYFVVDKVGALLRRTPFSILIEGHTDGESDGADNPEDPNAAPADAWDLSSARATGVLRYLLDVVGIEKRRLGLVGYGSSRPAASSDTAQGRAKNRRVEFVCYRGIHGL